eukprot:scaffold1431_cov346-Pavlova_lutheri.AAC.34
MAARHRKRRDGWTNHLVGLGNPRTDPSGCLEREEGWNSRKTLPLSKPRGCPDKGRRQVRGLPKGRGEGRRKRRKGRERWGWGARGLLACPIRPRPCDRKGRRKDGVEARRRSVARSRDKGAWDQCVHAWFALRAREGLDAPWTKNLSWVRRQTSRISLFLHVSSAANSSIQRAWECLGREVS